MVHYKYKKSRLLFRVYQFAMASAADSIAFLDHILGKNTDGKTKADLHNLLLYVYNITSKKDFLQLPLQWFKEYNQNLISNGFAVVDFEFQMLPNSEKLDDFCEEQIRSDPLTSGSQHLFQALELLQSMHERELVSEEEGNRGIFKYFRCSNSQGSGVIFMGIGMSVSSKETCYRVVERISYNPDDYKLHQDKVEKFLKDFNYESFDI